MKHLISILCCAFTLTACNGMTPYEKQPPLNFNMNCKEINAALKESRASLERIKERRNTVTGEDVGVFLLTLGEPTYGGVNAQKEAEERITLLESAALSRRCTITR